MTFLQNRIMKKHINNKSENCPKANQLKFENRGKKSAKNPRFCIYNPDFTY